MSGESQNMQIRSTLSENVLEDKFNNTVTESSVRKSEVLTQTVEEEETSFNSYGRAGIRLLPQQTAIYDAY